jgi:cytochrome c1
VCAKFLAKTGSIAFGIALLLAALFFDGGTAAPDKLQVTPVNTLSASERLLKPTLPAEPSQADQGAQDYWLYCLPCHGEKGQGLTAEFRETYPPEEVDCWQSGCHGKTPYENGFILPTKVPAVIGQGTLAKFSDAAQLNSYIRAAMPFWKPGSLTEQEAWNVTAFILRENDLWKDAVELGASNAASVKIPRGAFLTPAATAQQAGTPNQSGATGWFILILVLLLFLILLFILKKSRNTTTI